MLSRDFQQFVRAVEDSAKDTVIEFQLIDVFADVGTFHYARDMLHEKGFRVLIDGLNPIALQFFEPARLAADFIKLEWSREFAGDVGDEHKLHIAQAVKNAGRTAAVLSRVESEEAMKFGLGLGIVQFQGFFVDKIAQAMRGKGMI